MTIVAIDPVQPSADRPSAVLATGAEQDPIALFAMLLASASTPEQPPAGAPELTSASGTDGRAASDGTAANGQQVIPFAALRLLFPIDGAAIAAAGAFDPASSTAKLDPHAIGEFARHGKCPLDADGSQSDDNGASSDDDSAPNAETAEPSLVLPLPVSLPVAIVTMAAVGPASSETATPGVAPAAPQASSADPQSLAAEEAIVDTSLRAAGATVETKPGSTAEVPAQFAPAAPDSAKQQNDKTQETTVAIRLSTSTTDAPATSNLAPSLSVQSMLAAAGDETPASPATARADERDSAVASKGKTDSATGRRAATDPAAAQERRAEIVAQLSSNEAGADGKGDARTGHGQSVHDSGIMGDRAPPDAAQGKPAASDVRDATAAARADGTAQPTLAQRPGETAGIVHSTGDGTTARVPASERVPLQYVALHISKALASGVDHLTVDLSPAELGRIEIRLDIANDGHVQAAIRADNRTTLDLLQGDSRNLERALESAGLRADAGSLNFSLRSDGQSFGGFANFAGREESGAAPSDTPPAVPAPADIAPRSTCSGIDLII